MYSNETRNAYVELVKEGRSALKEIDPSMETSMAVPFNPEPLGCVTGRCKYWANMAEYMDQVFVMGYDSQDNVLVGKFIKIWVIVCHRSSVTDDRWLKFRLDA